MPMLQGKNLKKVYAAIKKQYRSQVGRSFRFKKGEKKRVKDIFTHVREALGNKKEQEFSEVFKCFYLYVKKQTQRWISWDKASRLNYIGFLDRPDDVYTFVAAFKKKFRSSSEEKEIAGTKKQDAWEF